ncbi:MAG TPA: VOC family protein [Burkholderiaceae bacterium]
MTVKAIPEGMHTVTPHLICEGAAEAMAFYEKAFNAERGGVMPGAGGKIMHAQMKIGDSHIMLVDDFPEWGGFGPKHLKGTPVTLHLYVQDVDAAFQQAIDAGATAKMPPADMFWGDRYGTLVDPFGHSWSLATHKRDLTPEQMQEEMAKTMPECGKP